MTSALSLRALSRHFKTRASAIALFCPVGVRFYFKKISVRANSHLKLWR
jgi:hypothetical protein